MTKVLKKTIVERKRQLRNLYKLVPSWRRISEEYYAGRVKHGVLNRFALHADYVPADPEIQQELGLIVPPNPYRALPRWYKRTPEALAYFDRKRAQIRTMSDAAKEQRKATR
jgi:hypothetical protein